MGDLRRRKKEGLGHQSGKYSFEDRQRIHEVKQGALLGNKSLCTSLLMSSRFNFAKLRV